LIPVSVIPRAIFGYIVSFRQSCVIVVRRLVFRFAGRFDPEEQLVPFVMFA
jgi:hypothetical protein